VTRGKYKDYRLAVTQLTGAALVCAATYVIKKRNMDPDAALTDEFLQKFLPTGS
jgi:hypothetical protein